MTNHYFRKTPLNFCYRYQNADMVLKMERVHAIPERVAMAFDRGSILQRIQRELHAWDDSFSGARSEMCYMVSCSMCTTLLHVACGSG